MARSTRYRGIAGATVAGLLDRVRASGPQVAPTTDRLDGRTALVSGASRGLGLAVATGLAALGARVILACRTRQQEAPADVRREVPNADLRVVGVDLAELGQVEALADALKGEPLDIVVLNAGVASVNQRTPAGLDRMMHINWLASVQLVDRLVADGTLAAREGRPAPRIVVVGSESHRSAELVDIPSLATPEDYPLGQALVHYGRSKLLLHSWAVALGRQLADDGIHVHHLCPGAIDSDIAREAPGVLRRILRPVMRLGFQSPETAAIPVLYLAASRAIEDETGVYLHMRRRRDPSGTALDPEVGRRVLDEGRALLARLKED